MKRSGHSLYLTYPPSPPRSLLPEISESLIRKSGTAPLAVVSIDEEIVSALMRQLDALAKTIRWFTERTLWT